MAQRRNINSRDVIISESLTEEQFQELHRVTKDPFFFSTFITVINPVEGKVPFSLYPYQYKVLAEFIRSRFTIIKKFRQGGLTELISLFCLWLAMYHSNKNINIISIKDTVAKKVLRKIKFMYRNLPPHLRTKVINGRPKEIGTASEMEFSNGSIITSIPTTEEAGRSESLSLLVIDEAAIVRWADQIWAAAFPTLSTGGRAILNSTPYGVGNFFHKKWVEAHSQNNPFVPINLTWQMHPERGIDGDKTKKFPYWYNQMSEALGPRRTAQEIDGDFLTSGHTVFDLVDIRAIEDTLGDWVPIQTRNDPAFRYFNKALSGKIRPLGDALKIFSKPDPRRKYSIGADVSTGRSRDYSTFTIQDDHGEEAGCFKMKIPVNELAEVLMALGTDFNRAILGPESNDIGLAVASKIQEDGYPNLYYAVKLIKEKGVSRPKEEKIPGWYTTKKNRPVILGELEEDIRLGNISIKDPFFTQEAYTFIYDEQNRPVAMGKGRGSESDTLVADDEGYSDDAIMAKAITNHIRKKFNTGPIILPR